VKAMLRLLPDFLRAIHNAGCFNFSAVAFTVFLLRLASPVVVILAWCSLLGSALWRRARNLRRIGRLPLYTLAVFTVIVGTITGVFLNADLSHVYFGLGYTSYLNRRDDAAVRYYVRSLNRNASSPLPAQHLLRLYAVGGAAGMRLEDIRRLLAVSRDHAVLASLAELYASEGDNLTASAVFTSSLAAGGGLDVRVCLISALRAAGRYVEARAAIDSAFPLCDTNGAVAELKYQASLLSGRCGDPNASLNLIEEALRLDGENPDYLLQKGRVLSDLGKEEPALSCLQRASNLRRVLPEAYRYAGRIHYMRKDRVRAEEALRRAIYFDNTDVLSQAMLMSMRAGTWLPVSSIVPLAGATLRADRTNLTLELGGLAVVALELTGANWDPKKGLQAAVLNPYGFGVIATLKTVKAIPTRKGCIVELELRATRDNRRNQGRPWKVKTLVFDPVEGWYVQADISVSVSMSAAKPGRILYVLTEDLEVTGDFPHVDTTPGVVDIDPQEVGMDLDAKVELAEAIGARTGVRWSHMVDLGSAVLRVAWAGEQDVSGSWKQVTSDIVRRRAESLRSGHDIQLHMHGYSIPDNRLARSYLDRETGTIRFAENTVRVADANGNNGAWAYNFTRIGSYDDPESRIGSLFRGVQTLESELRKIDTTYRVITFRAGEYEFGREPWEARKSVSALISNGLLADSNAIEGSQDRRGFRFFDRIGDNAYFTTRDSIWQRATTPNEIGVLEVLPVPNGEGSNYLQPTDKGEDFERSYNLCLENGNVKDGIFIIMEMYHIGNTNSVGQWDNLEATYGDWKRMADHFKYIRRRCPLVEPVKFSEAVKTYLDVWAPDLVAILTSEEHRSAGILEFGIEFLGSEIMVDDATPHFVAVKPPSYYVGSIRRAELIHEGNIEKTWDTVDGYSDLEFEASDRGSYRLRVYM
jgi:tetratricopeptide (TPR) repeat protein